MKDETILEVTEKVELAISTMSDKLGIAADKFYPIITQQMFYEGIMGVCLGVFIFIIGSALNVVGWKEHTQDVDPFGWLLCGITVQVIGVAFVGYSIVQLFNPEYYALREIMSFVK